MIYQSPRYACLPTISSFRIVLGILELTASPSRTNPLLVITVAGHNHPISFPLVFEVSEHNLTDLVLGTDWAAFFRDSLLGLGYQIESSFNPWQFVLDPTFPVVNGAHVLTVPPRAQPHRLP